MRALRSGLAAFLACAGIVTSVGAAMAATDTDPFLWLEDVEGQKALDWVRAQNDRSLKQLTGDARYDGYYKAALEIAEDKARIPFGAIRAGWVYNFWQDDTHVRGIWRRATLASYEKPEPEWQTILDLDALAKDEGKNWVWKAATCLRGTELCLLTLSDGGKDASVEREFDIGKKAFVSNGFVLPEAKSSVAWQDANTLLVSTDWGAGSLTVSGYPFIVKRWVRGTPLATAALVHSGTAQDVAVSPARFDGPNGQSFLGVIESNTFFSSTVYALNLDVAGKDPSSGAPPELHRMVLPPKSTPRGLFNGELVFTLEQDWDIGGKKWASGSLLSAPVPELSSANPRIKLILVPGARESVDDVQVSRAGLLVASYANVRGRILRATFDGKRWTTTRVPFPDTGAVGIVTTDESDSVAHVTYQDFLQPTTLYSLQVDSSKSTPIKSLPAKFDASAYVTDQMEARSKDGTQVPYFVIRRKDMKLDGSSPTLLYAYGGFQISMLPSYSGTVGRLWLDQGGVYVLANIRGGGEFGPKWHDAGLKTKRQVVYDDFIGVAEDLIRRRITSTEHLGIMGGSNGGLLMGVMLTQRPELFNAVVVQVPLLDMLRFDQLLAGASWVDEYGSPSVPAERAWLEKLSPYQNLTKRPGFPVPYFETSTKDDRVHPGHARKYAARMESLGLPFLYYENIDGGHSAAANLRERAKRQALEFTYLAQRLMPSGTASSSTLSENRPN